jgi:hypothetical protein
MYAFKPDRRTLQMAQDQWSSEVEALDQRKANIEIEKAALEDGVACWAGVVGRVRAFEKQLRDHTFRLTNQATKETPLNSSPLSPAERSMSPKAEDDSLKTILESLSKLVTSLEDDLAQAESKNWNLLVCAIGAELSALEQARDLLEETNPDSDDLIDGSDSGRRAENDVRDAIELNEAHHSPASSNHSLEDTLRQFVNPLYVSQGGQGPQVDNDPGAPWQDDQNDTDVSGTDMAAPRSKMAGRSMTMESEDDEPGPEFLLSQS